MRSSVAENPPDQTEPKEETEARQMRKLKLYIAASMDGFIAGPNGEIDWLEEAGGKTDTVPGTSKGEDYGYGEFYASIDTTLMGMETYRVVLTADELPYPDKTNYVFTRSGRADRGDEPYVRFVNEDVAGFTRSLLGESGGDVWLVGGGQINTIMLNEGLIDEVILTSFPVVLGTGIPLFGRGASRQGFQTVGFQAYDSGLIQWRMARR
jgi:dihydrofolate reductase